MKIILTTLVASSIMVMGGCNKTKKSSVNTSTVQLEELDVEAIDGEIVIMINGEKQVIDLSEVMDDMPFGLDGEMQIAVMAHGDKEGQPMQWIHDGVDGEMEIHIVVNGEEVEGVENILKMLDGIVDIDMEAGDGEHRVRMMRMMGGGNPEEMGGIHERMMRMMGGGPRGGARHDMRGERQLHERDFSEEHQFMEELGMLGAVAEHLAMNESVALLGIHMIRDNLEGDMQLEALRSIIEDAGEGTPTRNAAIVTTIQALLEMERNDEAAELMIELAVSNSN